MSGQVCARCKKESDHLNPMPRWIRVLMSPANMIFPVFRPTTKYCPKCKRAMITPVLVLLLIAIGVLSIMPLRWLGVIR